MAQSNDTTTTQKNLDIDFNKDWELIKSVLPENLHELAKQHKQIPPKSATKAKIFCPHVLLRILFCYVLSGLSLAAVGACSNWFGIASLSKVAISYRLQAALPFLTALLRTLCKTDSNFAVERWAGYEVFAIDASLLSVQGSIQIDARIHYFLRLADLSIHNILVTTERIGETFKNIKPKKDQLYIADRGYCNAPGIAYMVSKKADVLVRLNFGTLFFHGSPAAKSKHIKLEEKLSDMSIGETREYTYWIKPKHEKPIQGRVIAFRLNEEQTRKAQQRVRKNKKARNKKAALERAKFVVVFTTVPKERLSKEALMELYGLRWQVELEIKRSKSLGNVDKLRCTKPKSVQAWLLVNILSQELLKRLLKKALDNENIPTEELAIRNKKERSALWAKYAFASKVLQASVCPMRLHELIEQQEKIWPLLIQDHQSRHRPTAIDKFLVSHENEVST